MNHKAFNSMRFISSINLVFKNPIAFASLLLFVNFSLGCNDEPGIVQHKVHKSRSGLVALREPELTTRSPQNPAAAATTKNRMAIAVFDKPEATWFFKVNGPVDQVNAAEEQWLAFFNSVKFEDGQPKWEAPEQWTEAGPKPMRTATFLIASANKESKPLELAVSSLGPNQNMLLNVNRWRGQLGQEKFSQEQLETQLKPRESQHGKYLLFDAEGTGSGSMRPPFAGGTAPFSGGKNTANAPTTANRDLKFTAPAGWSAGKTSSMVQARFSKTDGEAKAQITVIEMPADANEWAPNVKRWAGQVGLNDLTDEQLADRTSEIKVDQVPGQLVELVTDAESENGVVAAMVKRKGSAWFFKLSGEKELVEQSREEFETFMDSIRYQ